MQTRTFDLRTQQRPTGVSAETYKDLTPEFIDTRFRQQSLEKWRDEMRQTECSDAELFLRMTVILTPLLEYLAGSGECSSLSMRAWCVLYATSPSLINHESTASFARRAGVSETAVQQALRKIESAVPGFSYARLKPSGQNISAAQRRAAALRKSRMIREGATL